MVYFYSTQLRTDFPEEIVFWEKSITSIADVLSKEPILAIDCETTGLNPLSDKVVMLQFGTPTDQYVIDTRGFSVSKYFKELLENPNILKVGHNIKFDYNMLKQHGIVMNNVYDTMVCDRVIYNGKYTAAELKALKRYSLAGVYKHYFGKVISKTVRSEFLYLGSNPFSFEQIYYGAKDVVYPLEIHNVQKHWITKYNLDKKISMENKTLLTLGDIEYNGFYLDSEKWLKIHSAYYSKIKNTLLELDTILISKDDSKEVKCYQLSLFGDTVRDRLTDVNWNSDRQVYKILTSTFDVWPEDKDGKASSGAKALDLLDTKPPIVKALLKYRKQSKIISSFGKVFLDKYLHDDSRIRTTFNQIVDTGRMSSRNPNCQQIPKGSEKGDNGSLVDDFRGAFIAPYGKKIITADFSAQEQRVMCNKADDENFIEFFNKGGGDIHCFIAQTMYSASAGHLVEVINDKSHPNYGLRQKGKILGFMISFGGSAFTLSKTLKIPVEEAEELINSYFKGFPKLKIMFDKAVKFAMEHGYVVIDEITKGIRWLPEFNEYKTLSNKPKESLTKEERSKKAKLAGRIRRKAMNTGIQGEAASITKTALILLRNYLLEHGIQPLSNAKIKIVACIHDECVVEADEDSAELAAALLQKAMETAGSIFVTKVKMPASPVILDHWDH